VGSPLKYRTLEGEDHIDIIAWLGYSGHNGVTLGLRSWKQEIRPHTPMTT